ncbi:MAG: peptide deformylase [Melioribacteraceae bacterium]|nr:peptide deformylase [Melioribacteraceae bacterium]MCF8265292.1 peptide deformylase [Melioribacteraceae bacterium]MCF8412551.1 peptide deformylase [Melioribacteraceae bacterium]
MAILPITVYGDHILREKTKKIENIDSELIVNIKNMFDSMRNASGIGLAANQLNLNKSFFVLDLSVVEGYEGFKPMVMINPEIIEQSDELVTMEEGCLSLPLLRTDVERPEIIKVRYLDADENIKEIEADDLFARVILHEYDHLIGKMIPDRVDIKTRKKLQTMLQKIQKRKVDIDYPITEL